MDLDADIRRVAAETSFSGVVSVSLAGERLHASAHGLAERANGRPFGLETRLALASGAKSFTALGAVALVADGVLSLATTARSLLGDRLPLVDDAVTIEHLLGHTSGVGEYLDDDADTDDHVLAVPVHELVEPLDLLRLLEGHAQASAPGERCVYSNSGYVLLGGLVELASPDGYHRLLQTRVFDAAGMASTAFDRSDELPADTALGYLEVGHDRTNLHHLPVRGAGDGGVTSTLADLDAFWAALFAGRIVPPPLVEQMVTPRAPLEGEPVEAGLGFFVRPGTRTVQFEGMDAGISFRSAYDRDSTASYTVIGNTSETAWPLVRHLQESLPSQFR